MVLLITCLQILLILFMSPSSSIFVMTADGTPMSLAGVGYVVTPNLSLCNVYHILKLMLNLASIGQLCDSGDLVTFSSSSSCYVQDLESQKLIGIDHRKGNYMIWMS